MEKNKPNEPRAHLIGICGAGMSALAILLKEKGYIVTGSDSNFYDPISGYLKKNKISFFKTYSPNNIPKDADVIVIGKHAELTPETNSEVKTALENGKNIKSLSEALADLTKNKESLVVAGSFGKSTSTALIAWCLREAKRDPSYFIGGVPINFPKSSHLGKGEEFVIEGDEYPSSNWDNTSKFLHFNPSSLLLISGMHDHLNVFPTLKSYIDSYKKLVTKIPQNGLLVYSLLGKNNKDIIKDSNCRKVTYALNDKRADYSAKNIKYRLTTSFDLIKNGKKIATLKTKLLGNHNLENIIGTCAFLLEQNKVSVSDLKRAILNFVGIKKRIELKTKNSSVPVYEGFGSSYEKAKAVFDTLNLHFPKKKIVAVFEPHAFSWRNRGALKWYRTIFNNVSVVVLLPPPAHGKDTHDQLSFDEIFNEVKKHTKVHQAKNEKEALSLLKKTLDKNSIVALVSSGSLLGLSKSLPRMVERLF